jgi:uncharacterized protein YlzI (FlbEa/FlbD family)
MKKPILVNKIHKELTIKTLICAEDITSITENNADTCIITFKEFQTIIVKESIKDLENKIIKYQKGEHK